MARPSRTWDFMVAFRLSGIVETIEHYRHRVSHLGLATEVRRVQDDHVWLGFTCEATSAELAVQSALLDSAKLLSAAEFAAIRWYSMSHLEPLGPSLATA